MPPESNASTPAQTGRDLCDKLFAVEKEIQSLPPEQRQEKRLVVEQPMLRVFWCWLDELSTQPLDWQPEKGGGIRTWTALLYRKLSEGSSLRDLQQPCRKQDPPLYKASASHLPQNCFLRKSVALAFLCVRLQFKLSRNIVKITSTVFCNSLVLRENVLTRKKNALPTSGTSNDKWEDAVLEFDKSPAAVPGYRRRTAELEDCLPHPSGRLLSSRWRERLQMHTGYFCFFRW